MKRGTALCAAAALFAYLCPSRAAAQQYVIGADASISTGAEAGGPFFDVYRARTRLRLGADVHVDEFPDDVFELGLLAELEPKSSVGADVRYARPFGEHFVLDAGALGIVAPRSLVGVCGGVTYRMPLSKGLQLTLGPETDFYFVGSDLPGGTVIWEVRLVGGVRVQL